MSVPTFRNVLSTSSLQQVVHTVHDQLCLCLLGKGKDYQMPYKKVKGSLSFLGKAASFLGVLSCTGVLLWQGSVIHAGEGEQCALLFNFGFAGNFTYYERQSLAKHTGAGLKAAGFLLPLACFQPLHHLHSSFQLLFVSSWVLSKGRAFRSDLILFHALELHHTWQVLGIQPGQQVPGLDQGPLRSVILQLKELCEALRITTFMCYHYHSILSVWDCFPLITSLNQY